MANHGWVEFAMAFDPTTLNADGGGGNCGTGSGGFKPGNTCGGGGSSVQQKISDRRAAHYGHKARSREARPTDRLINLLIHGAGGSVTKTWGGLSHKVNPHLTKEEYGQELREAIGEVGQLDHATLTKIAGTIGLAMSGKVDVRGKSKEQILQHLYERGLEHYDQKLKDSR